MNYNMKNPNALAVIRGGKEAPCLSGEIRFYQEACSVLVAADVFGLPKESETEFFALHIHEGKSCCGEDFSNTKGHYNPKSSRHPKHSGDLPPLLNCNGCAYLAVRTDRFCVRDIIGRTVVIHSGPDDFTSQPAGNAGVKIGCGEICAR